MYVLMHVYMCMHLFEITMVEMFVNILPSMYIEYRIRLKQ